MGGVFEGAEKTAGTEVEGVGKSLKSWEVMERAGELSAKAWKAVEEEPELSSLEALGSHGKF